MPSVKSLMTPFPYSLDEGAPISVAQEFMRKHKIRHLPVTRDDELIGVVSDRDIKLMLGPDFAYPDASELLVRTVMVSDPYIVDLNTPLHTVLAHMSDKHIGSAVVTRKGKLAGVFTVTDACRGFAEFLCKQVRYSGGDAAA